MDHEFPKNTEIKSPTLQLNDNDEFFAPSTSSSTPFQNYPSTSTSEQKFSFGLNSDDKNDLSPLVRDDELEDFMDDFLTDPQGPSTSGYPSSEQLSRMEAAKKAADEDLEVLLKETDDMQDIQNQIHLEQVEMAEKYREERSRQRRAAAARTRYQRMSENERRLYNHRRRLRTLGFDPTDMKSDIESAKVQVKQANAKKAEAARARYHRMSAEQKRDYNMRRTEAFRRRRQEEEMLLSTPAGRISAEALAKAQQIMVRNQRKAESARLRYQRMTADERKTYNMKRATAKRIRKMKPPLNGSGVMMTHADDVDPTDIYVDDLDDDDHLDASHELDDSHEMNQNGDVLLDEELLEDGTTEDHMIDVINEVAHPSEMEMFNRMENDVIRRTRIAHATIQRQSNMMSFSPNAVVGGIQYDMGTSHVPMIGQEVKMCELLPRSVREPSQQEQQPQPIEKTHVIDDRMLQEMVRTGHDQNGQPVLVQTADGRQITSVNDLIEVSHGQTVLITQQQQPQQMQGPSSSHQMEMDSSYDPMPDDGEVEFEPGDEHLSPAELKIKRTRARRAERARARYHRMSEDQRKEQNARRALTLRKSRARDDQLCQMFDTIPHEQIDAATMKSIQEAQARRARRALQARTKYQKMDSEQRRKYNSLRDAQRRSRRAVPDGKDYEGDEEDEEEYGASTSTQPITNTDASGSGDNFYSFPM